MKDIIITDLDGVLADSNPDTFPFNQPPMVWDIRRKEVEGVLRDLRSIEFTVKMIRHLFLSHDIYIVTSRFEFLQDVTQDWLTRHHIPFHQLFMQPPNKFAHGVDFKRSIVKGIKAFGDRRIALALEDRLNIVRMYREYGILTFHTADGLF